MDITQNSVVELLDHLRNKRISAVELVRAFLDRIDRYDGSIRSLILVNSDEALRSAEASDRQRAGGETLGPLAGIPLVLKDLICTRDLRTTCASRILRDFVPPYDAGVSERLKDAGAIILGKSNMDEFAMGSSTENSCLGPSANPWDLTRTPGGSSGGSAACVAARLAPMALGSDTGGSIRQPASFCGVVGLKPTYGRVSRYGLIAYASSLDQIGPITQNVSDAALLLEVIAGHDCRDSTSVSEPVPSYSKTVDDPVQGLRIGVVRDWFEDGLDPEVAAAIEEALAVYRSAGAELVDVELPHSRYGVPTYYLIATAEASSNLARYEGVHYGLRAERFSGLVDMYNQSRAEGFGEEVKRRIMLGTYALSAGYYDAYYLKALKVRRLIREDFDRAFEKVDCVIGPTSPIPPFKLGEKVEDPLQMYLVDVFTNTANLAGIAGVSIPAGFTKENLPVGLQLLAAPFQEDRLLRIARAYEREAGWLGSAPALQG